MKEHDYFYFLALAFLILAINGAYLILPVWVVGPMALGFLLVAGLCTIAAIESVKEARREEQENSEKGFPRS